jgi:Ni/Co efflux regulator RcnB
MKKVQSILAALTLVAALAASFIAGRAHAAQPHMASARNHLRNARQELRDATADKGGHRERAMTIIDEAIAEVDAGIDYARGR